MIAYIKGHVRHITEESLILDAQGVGYLVLCPFYLLQKAQEHRNDFPLWCVMHMREEAATLYGLESFEARALFLILTRTPGIGGRMALNLFSELGLEGILETMMQNDEKRFQKADGVGPKMAKRLLMELKNQQKAILKKVANVTSLPHDSSCYASYPHEEDVLKALRSLGYTDQETHPIVHALLTKNAHTPLEELLRRTLQTLGQKAHRV